MATMKRLLKLEIWKLAQYRTNLLVLLVYWTQSTRDNLLASRSIL